MLWRGPRLWPTWRRLMFFVCSNRYYRFGRWFGREASKLTRKRDKTEMKKQAKTQLEREADNSEKRFYNVWLLQEQANTTERGIARPRVSPPVMEKCVADLTAARALVGEMVYTAGQAAPRRLQEGRDHMKRCVAITAWLATVLLSAGASLAQQDFSGVEISATALRGPIHMLTATAPAGNIGVSVGPDGLLIVDDQFAPLADKIKAVLSGLGGGPLRFILNTHWHGDHTGGNPVFGKQAPIIAHTNVRKRLMTGQRIGDRAIPAAPPAAWPVVTFDESVSIHFNGEEVRVVHFPRGHTDGDSVVFFTGSNVVHLGDHFFAGSFPFVDLDSGGDVEQFPANIATVLGQVADDVQIIPGHGPLSSKAELHAYHRMLVATTGFVRRQIDAEKSLEQIQAAGLPDEWKDWASGSITAERWIAMVYHSLTRAGRGRSGT